MKIVLNTICVLSLTLLMNAQSLNVHKNDGAVQSFTISEIDKITFTSSPCPPTVLYDGKSYNTVLIGNQCWLKENLDIGNMITGTALNNGIIEKYCYNHVIDSCTIYGGLYKWNEAMQYVTTPGAKGICPTGWHIPTYTELQTLATAVVNDGNALKAIGQGTGSGAGTNTSGFSALLAGFRYDNGSFSSLGYETFFWSSTEFDATNAYSMYLWNTSPNILSYYDRKEFGYSVRCIKD